MRFSKHPLDADASPRLAKERLVHRGVDVAPTVIPLAAPHRRRAAGWGDAGQRSVVPGHFQLRFDRLCPVQLDDAYLEVKSDTLTQIFSRARGSLGKGKREAVLTELTQFRDECER